MSERPQYEKYEKDEEKGEKEEEKQSEEKQEKNWEEKWRRDPLGTAVWAIILIWAGLVWLVESMGLLGRVRILESRLEAWPVILIGVGIILLLEIVVRLLVPSYRRPVGGTLVLAIILAGVGLGSLFDMSKAWPVVLIAIGVALLLRGLFRF